MALPIRLLEPRLANQIAAGEVVDRPASVVKELLENAIDANASKIEIDIERGGTRLIRLTDNGDGIEKSQLSLALTRHATSKIANSSDLAAIATLGFRGEALASISSVSRLTLISRPKQQSEAWQANAEGAAMEVQLQPAAAAEGTRLEVRDLFFNTPARQKFLRAERTEFNHIEDVVKKAALAHPEIAILLKHNGKIVRRFKATDSAHFEQRLREVCGQPFIDAALPFNCRHEFVKLSGWLTAPHFHRSESDLQFIFINGRPVKDKSLNHAVRQAYEGQLPQGRFSGYVIFLQMALDKVDVNVHPTKHEVRFSDQRLIHDLLAKSIREALNSSVLLRPAADEMATVQVDFTEKNEAESTMNTVFTSDVYDGQEQQGQVADIIRSYPEVTSPRQFGEPISQQSAAAIRPERVDYSGDRGAGHIAGNVIQLQSNVYLLSDQKQLKLIHCKRLFKHLFMLAVEGQCQLNSKALLFPSSLKDWPESLEEPDVCAVLEAVGFRFRIAKNHLELMAVGRCFASADLAELINLFLLIAAQDWEQCTEHASALIKASGIELLLIEQPELLEPTAKHLLDCRSVNFEAMFEQ